MALNNSTINKNFKNKGKAVKYLNKDFASFRQNLIDFTKTYFPTTFSDFNESSPGMLFIELASYIGDSLSYYIDDTLRESLMPYAQDRQNVMALSEYLGYKPKVSSPALTTLSVYQLVPSTGTGASNQPDSDYYLRIKEGMEMESTSTGITFRTTELLDFSVEDGREVTVYQRDGITNEPTFYLIRKEVNAISATTKEIQVDFSTAEQFSSININDTNVIQILDIRDSDDNKWYEVPYLAQEMVYVDYPNTQQYDKDLAQFKDSVPNILQTIKTSRRFVWKINEDNTSTIQFGAGDPSANDELLIPTFKNVGLGLPNSISKLDATFDPSNFLKTKSYGASPVNTTMTVRYLVGGGVSANVAKGDLTRITSIEFDDDTEVFSGAQLTTYNTVKNSVAAENEIPAVGGRGQETVEEIRENALAVFGGQNRAVTRKDYQVRALSMPAKYGSVAKSYVAQDGELDNNSPSSILASPDSLNEFADLVQDFNERELTQGEIKTELEKFLVGKKSNLNEKNNPFAINLYVLGYNSTGKLTTINQAVKENLKTYMSEYRMLTDGVNLLDGFIVNIGVEFDITVYGNYNNREVIAKCSDELKQFFQIDNWTFNQTINISDIELLLANVEGVQSVPMVKITNKCNGNYSSNSYNISAATKGKIVYPSLDPCCFELKFPEKDIKGRVV